MSYEPTEWKAGDIVTSAKLNKMEQGIKNNVLVTNLISTGQQEGYLDKTWQEIYDADFCVIAMIDTNIHQTVPVQVVFYGARTENEPSAYTVQTNMGYFYTDTPDGYPSINNVSSGEK